MENANKGAHSKEQGFEIPSLSHLLSDPTSECLVLAAPLKNFSLCCANLGKLSVDWEVK